MKGILIVDNNTYEDFTDLKTIFASDDYIFRVDLIDDAGNAYDLSSEDYIYTTSLIFTNTVKHDDIITITGTVATAASGIVNFDSLDAFTNKSKNAYRVQVRLTRTEAEGVEPEVRHFTANMGKIIIL